MKRFSETPHNVRDGFLAVTFDIFRNEQHFWGYHSLEEGRGERCWGPVDTNLFAIPIGLGNVTLHGAVTGPESIEKATIIVEDELITVSSSVDPDVYEEDWNRDMLDRLQDSYYGHPHPLCFKAKREQILAANTKAAEAVDKISPNRTSSLSGQYFKE